MSDGRFTDQDLDDEEIGGRIHWAHPPLMQRVPWERSWLVGWSEKADKKIQGFCVEKIWGGVGVTDHEFYI